MIETIADLVAFLGPFHRHWFEDPSLPAQRVPDWLSPPLKELDRGLGGLLEFEPPPGPDFRPLPFRTEDELFPVDRLRWVVDDMVEFARENRDDWSARCPIGAADPPVYANVGVDDVDDDGEEFVLVCSSLERFLVTFGLQEALFRCRYLRTVYHALEVGQGLALPLFPLWLDGEYVDGPTESRHRCRFYSSSDRDLIVMKSEACLLIGSNVDKVDRFVKKNVTGQLL